MDARQIERRKVDGNVRCEVAGKVSQDALRDLSALGCGLRGVDSVMMRGAEIDLTLLGSNHVSGTVRWAREGDVGIEFAERLSEAAVRYFALPDPATIPEDVTRDTFGRKLPPLGRIGGTNTLGA